MKFLAFALAVALGVGSPANAIGLEDRTLSNHPPVSSASPGGLSTSNLPNPSITQLSSLVMPILVLSGRSASGEALTVVAGPNPEGLVFSYKWFSGGRSVAWVTGNRYLLTGADVGRTVSVLVQGAKAGQPPVSQTLSTQGNVSGGPGITPSVWSTTGGLTSFEVTQRNLSGQTISSFNLEIAHDVLLACPTSCKINAQAVRSGASPNVSFGVTLLLRNSSGLTVASQYIFLSNASPRANFSFDLTANQLPLLGSGSFSIIPSLSGLTSRELFTTRAASLIEVFRGQNASQFRSPTIQLDPSVRSTSQDTVRGPGGSILFSYALPLSVDTITECAPLVIYVAPISLTSGAPDSTTLNASDVRISLRSPSGTQLEEIAVTGKRGEWATLSRDFRFETKVCGLTTQLGQTQTVLTQLELYYYAFNQTFTSTLNFQTVFTGGLRWTSVNCFLGEDGMVVEAHQPTCPAGWTQTTARVIGNKIMMTSINCLRDKDLRVIRAPEPVCPPGYSITRLPVRDGKLIPKTLVCNKGETVRVISDPFPECPRGFAVTTRPVKNGKLVPITITCTKGVLLKRVTAAFPRCPAGYNRR